MKLLLHLLTSLHGTKRTCRHAATMSALGAKPDDICEAPGDQQGVEGASPLR